ncbi:MAG TPA: TRAP transporter small permease subunit [Bacteroidetes bacterium]|nr:TRAP transporter small permease subunit [Bacteroidota bacterium]
MIYLLKNISKKINELNEWVGKTTAWLTAILMLIVCFDVIARKLFNFSRIWIMDIEWHLYAMIFLLAAGYALRHDRHVRVDLFYEKFTGKDKALTNFMGHLLFLVPWCLVVIYYSFGYAVESLRLNEGSPEPGGLPARYFIKFCISIGIGLLLLQAIAGLIDAGLALFQNDFSKKENLPE